MASLSATQYNAALLLWGGVHDISTDIDDLNDWWTNEHLPERLSIPGFQRARRYHANDLQDSGYHRYLTVYDVVDLATLTSDAYMEKLNNPTAGTKKHLPTLATMSRVACTSIQSWTRRELQACSGCWGGYVLLLEAAALLEDVSIADAASRAIIRLDSLSRTHKSVISCRLLLGNAAATAPGQHSRSYDGVKLSAGEMGEGYVRLFLLVESAESLEPFSDDFVQVLVDVLGESVNVKRQGYRLMCCLSK